MITTIAVLAIIALYLAVGVGWAQARAIETVTRAKKRNAKEWSYSHLAEKYEPGAIRVAVSFDLFLFPISMLMYAAQAPVRRQEKWVAVKGEEKAYWEGVAHDSRPEMRAAAREMLTKIEQDIKDGPLPGWRAP